MAAKNSRDLERMREIISQASKMVYESQGAKRLYEQANRLGAAVRERQALIASIQADDQPTHQTVEPPEFVEGDGSQYLAVRNRRKREKDERRSGRHRVRSRSRDRGHDSRPEP